MVWSVTPWRFEDILGTGADYFHDPPFQVLQAGDRQLPHIWDIAVRAREPFQRGSESPCSRSSWERRCSPSGQAVIGFALGALIGIGWPRSSSTPRARSVPSCPTSWPARPSPSWRWRRSSCRRGLRRTAVVIIATYLTFFPVTIAQLRGLRSPDPRALELMRSYGASRWDVYRKLRMPASVPYLFTALKVAAPRPSSAPSSARARAA